MENEKEETKTTEEQLIEQVDKQIDEIKNMGVQAGNVEYLCRLLKVKKEVEKMRYREYGEYGEYDRYNDHYGARRRDSRGRYMGDEHLNEMHDRYRAYRDSKERYSRGGSYGDKDDSMKSLEYMLRSMTQFVDMLKQDADSQEEMELIRQYTRQLSEM